MRHRRWAFEKLRLGLLVGVVAALTNAGSATAFEPRVPETFFGVSATDHWAMSVQNRDAERDAQLNAMKAAGIDWVRVEIGWPEVEPNAPVGGIHAYDWAAADRMVAALAARNMELMAVPMATPAWAASARASGQGCGRRSEVAAARAADYGAFTAALVRRYGPTGAFWTTRPDLPRVPVRRIEIWNEQNLSIFWCPDPNPALYASLLKAAADGIHQADPGASVIVGGIAALQDSRRQGETVTGMAADEFLAAALAAQPSLTTAIDAVGLHPYDIDPSINLSLVGWLHRSMKEIGIGDAEIVLTEFGWPTGTVLGTLTELLRASNYSEMAGRIARIDCNVTGVAAYRWQSRELNIFEADDWYGLVSPLTGLLHPAGIAYRDQIALYEGRGPTPAPRTPVEICGEPVASDQDGDGVPDHLDDYPTDPTRSEGSGEVPPPAPEEVPEEPRTQPQRASDAFFGATLVQLPDDFTKLGDEFQALRGARIGTARMRVNWSKIEPLPPSDPNYSERSGWGWLDRIILKLGEQEIRFVPSFGDVPAWAPISGNAFDQQYALFMGRVALRYAPGGTFWEENRNLDEATLAIRDFEVWQWGNVPAHLPDGSTSAAEYAATYLGARALVKTAHPASQAIASLDELGAGGRAGDFLRAMVAAQPSLRGGIDGVHVFTEHSRTVAAVEASILDVRMALEDTGNASAPITLGFGAPFAGPGAMSGPARADFYSQVASRAVRGDCGVRGVFAHAWKTPELNPQETWDWFGLAAKSDGTLSSAGVAYRDTAAAFRGYGTTTPATEAVHPCGGQAPDSDGDGTPDSVDPAPLDPGISTPTATAPAAPSISGGPVSPTLERSATFSLAAAGATYFQCRFDSATRFTACPVPATFSGLAHGEHTLRIRGVSAEGLVGPETVKRWSVDLVGPDMASVTGPGAVSLSHEVRFEFASVEPSARLACRLDGHPWEWCTSPKVYAFIGEGAHEFRVAGVDGLGNIGAHRVLPFEVRTTPGVTTITQGPGEGQLSSASPDFRFNAANAASFECHIDGADWNGCSEAGRHQPPAPLTEGPHEFQVRAVGGSGTRGPASVRRFSVDASGPAVTIIPVTLTARQSRNRATFILKATDPAGIASLECKLDAGTWAECSESHTVRRLTVGRHTLRARAEDSLGNAAAAKLRWRHKRS